MKFHSGQRIMMVKHKGGNHGRVGKCAVFDGLEGTVKYVNGEGVPRVMWDNGSECWALIKDGDQICIVLKSKKILDILNEK